MLTACSGDVHRTVDGAFRIESSASLFVDVGDPEGPHRCCFVNEVNRRRANPSDGVDLEDFIGDLE